MWPLIAAAAAATVIPMLLPKPKQPTPETQPNLGAAILRGSDAGGGPTAGMSPMFGGDNTAAKNMAANSMHNRTRIDSPSLAAALRADKQYGVPQRGNSIS